MLGFSDSPISRRLVFAFWTVLAGAVAIVAFAGYGALREVEVAVLDVAEEAAQDQAARSLRVLAQEKSMHLAELVASGDVVAKGDGLGIGSQSRVLKVLNKSGSEAGPFAGCFGVLVAGDGTVVAVDPLRKALFGSLPAVVNTKEISDGRPLSFSSAVSQDLRTVSKRMAQRESGVALCFIAGARYWVAFDPVEGTPWSVAVMLPGAGIAAGVEDASAAAAVKRMHGGVVLMLGAMVALCAGFALSLVCCVHWVGRPVQAMLKGFEKDSGPFFPESIREGSGELGTFGHMVESLRAELAQAKQRCEFAENRYREVFEHSVEGIYQTTLDGRFVFANPALAHMLGYASEQELMAEVTDIKRQLYVDPHQRTELLEQMGRDDSSMRYDAQLRKRDGSAIWCRIAGHVVRGEDGEIKFLNGLLEDITDSRLAADQIRSLSQDLMVAQETERRRISRDLHDNVAQILSSLKIDSSLLCDGYEGQVPDALRQKTQGLTAKLQDCILAVKNMAYDLRPSGLDEFGLGRALEQYCVDFSTRTGIRAVFGSAGMESLELASQVEINLYRLVQEALHNVEKHANASAVSVRLVASYPHVIVRIADNGRGMDLDAERAVTGKGKSMGLRSMKERARLLGGSLEMHSKPGSGMRLRVEIPVDGWEARV